METEAAAQHGGDRKSDQSAENKNGTLKRGTNSRTTRIARLKRDHPDVAKRVEAGANQYGKPDKERKVAALRDSSQPGERGGDGTA